MIKPWLIRIVGKTKQYISLQVLANWIGLLANIVVTASVARLLGALYEGSFEEGQLSATLLAALAAVVVRIVCTLAASRMSFLASDEVKRILRERISMESVLKELDPGIFVPVERGYVVNMKRIRRISGDTLYLEKGYEVQVSRTRLPKVKQEISRCWGGRRS